MPAFNDPRDGPGQSGQVQLVDADDDAPQTAHNVRSDGLFQLEAIKIGYDDGASATIDIAIFDDADGTAAGSVSDKRDVIKNIDPGESVTVDYDGMRDFEEDVLVQVEGGNQDGNVEVTVMGRSLTYLRDVVTGG